MGMLQMACFEADGSSAEHQKISVFICWINWTAESEILASFCVTQTQNEQKTKKSQIVIVEVRVDSESNCGRVTVLLCVIIFWGGHIWGWKYMTDRFLLMAKRMMARVAAVVLNRISVHFRGELNYSEHINERLWKGKGKIKLWFSRHKRLSFDFLSERWVCGCLHADEWLFEGLQIDHISFHQAWPKYLTKISNRNEGHTTTETVPTMAESMKYSGPLF